MESSKRNQNRTYAHSSRAKNEGVTTLVIFKRLQGFVFLLMLIIPFCSALTSDIVETQANLVSFNYTLRGPIAIAVYNDIYNIFTDILNITLGGDNFNYQIPFPDILENESQMYVKDKNSTSVIFDYNNSIINFTAIYSKSPYSISYKANDFKEINWYINETVGDYDKFTYVGQMNVTSNYSKDSIFIYKINKSRLPRFDEEIASMRELYVDNSSVQVSYIDEADWANMRVDLGHTGNYSLLYGEHEFKLVYYVSSGQLGGGGGEVITEEETVQEGYTSEQIETTNIMLAEFLETYGVDYTEEDLENLQKELEEEGIFITLDDLKVWLGSLKVIPVEVGGGGGGGLPIETDVYECKIDVLPDTIKLDLDHIGREVRIFNGENRSVLPRFAIYPPEDKPSAVNMITLRGNVQSILPNDEQRIIVTTNPRVLENLTGTGKYYAVLRTDFENCRYVENNIIVDSGKLVLPFFLAGVPLIENIKNFIDYIKNIFKSEIFSLFGIKITYGILFGAIFLILFLLLFNLNIPILTKITFPLFVSTIIVAIIRALLRG